MIANLRRQMLDPDSQPATPEPPATDPPSREQADLAAARIDADNRRWWKDKVAALANPNGSAADTSHREWNA
jgi:hypothetical protein